ncbi:MAG: Crp/Fnr family transcriptional regulator [Pseudomonadota bacterium]
MSDSEKNDAWSAFCGVSSADEGVRALSAASQLVKLEAGVPLIEQGSRSNCVFLITRGELKTVLFTENGHEIWLAKVTKGDLVGEISSLAQINRTSSVISTKPVDALKLSDSTFREVVHKGGRVSGAIAVLLANRLQNTTEKLAELVAMPVASRVHSELARIGTPSKADSEVFEIAEEVTVSSLGSRVHATREAASRAIGELEKRGLVRRERGTWTVIVPRDR